MRVRKTAKVKGKTVAAAVMWGLFAKETIPSGAFVVDYLGEILTAKEGDKRGKDYDQLGMSYLFDMIDYDESDEYDSKV